MRIEARANTCSSSSSSSSQPQRDNAVLSAEEVPAVLCSDQECYGMVWAYTRSVAVDPPPVLFFVPKTDPMPQQSQQALSAQPAASLS